MTPAVLMCELLAVYFGWQFFGNGPLAFYVLTGAWVAWRCWLLYAERGADWAPAALFGMYLGASQAACGLVEAGDGQSFLCDRYSGLPVSSLTLAIGAGIVAHYARRLQRGRTNRRR